MQQWHALLLSVAVECFAVLVALIFLRRVKGEARWRVIIAIAAATLLTHPIAWQINLLTRDIASFAPRVLCIEALVVVVEAALLMWASARKRSECLLLAGFANTASFLFGLWIYS